MGTRFLFLLLFLVLMNIRPANLFSQDRGFIHSILKGPVDTNYIRDYKDMFTGRYYLLTEAVGFSISPNGGVPHVEYRPNIFTQIGIAGFYQWIGMGISVKNPLYIRDNEEKGLSSIVDLRVNAYGKSLAAELSLQDYKGFYLGDSEEVIPGWKEQSTFYQRPDMQIRSIGALIYYVFNSDKHSFRAAWLQNEQQLKSSGGFVIMPSFLYSLVKADSALMPDKYISSYNIDKRLRMIKGGFLKLGLSAGYSYTLVLLKNVYVNASLIPGAFYQHYDYSHTAGDRLEDDFSLQWLGRVALGYNSRSFFAGAGGIFAYNAAPFDWNHPTFNFDMNQLRIWIGTRFKVKDPIDL